ncbi:protocadherin Fat 4-like [Saccoglossus kowalevskii]
MAVIRMGHLLCMLCMLLSTAITDGSPVFDASTTGVVYISENIAASTSIHRISATDTAGSTMTMSITGRDPTDAPFDLALSFTSSGTIRYDIRTNSAPGINFEERATYELIITVVDASSNSQQTTLTISVNDEPEAPWFVNIPAGGLQLGINENTGGGVSIYQLSANDQDSGFAPSFTISGGGGKFVIGSSTGVITTVANPGFDYESGTNSYSLTVQVSDGTGTASDSDTIQINIIDVNDNVPTFSSTYSTTYYVDEESNVGTTVVDIDATDTDSGDTVLFEFVNSENDFVIDAGAVLAEDSNVNDLVASLVCTDKDGSSPNNDITISMTSGSNVYFQYTNAGVVTVKSNLNYDDSSLASNNHRYELVFEAADGGSNPSSLTGTATVIVQITDINDNSPQFSQASYSASVDEDENVGYVVVTVVATDNDWPFDTVTYEIISGDDASQPKFSIEPITGSIKLRNTLDYETRSSYTLTVRATDGDLNDPNTVTASVVITIVNVNDVAPYFNPYVISVSLTETAANTGVDATSLNCIDEDSPNSEIVYDILSGNSEGKFTLPVTTGTLNPSVRLTTSIDYDDVAEAQSYTLVIRARDNNGAGLSGTAVVQVEITGINEDTPTFINPDPNPVSIPEQLSVGTSVVTIHADDGDRGTDGEVSYLLISGDTHESFEIDPSSGVIRIKKEIDYDTMGSNKYYSLVIRAVDGGDPAQSQTQSVSVTITDVNDIVPSCAVYLYTVTVYEDTVSNTKFVTLDCEDADSSNFGDLVYTISPSVTEFTMDQTDGGVTLANGQTLDYESGTQEYKLNIIVRDNDPTTANRLSTTVIVTVKVGPINEYSPSFTSSSDVTVYVDEDATNGYQVTIMSASDDDLSDHIHGIIRHRIDSPANVPFGIDSSTGTIKVTSGLDYETTTRYVLFIVAEDYGGLETTGTVTVSINDVNDNYPACSPTSHSGSIDETFSTSGEVVKITCTDDDSSVDGTVLFDLTQTPSSKFVISGTGSLTLDTAVDFDSGETTYILTVFARDNSADANLRKTTTIPISIEVNAVNEYTPDFDQDLYSETISEEFSVGDVFVTVGAVDNDRNDHIHGILTYTVTNGDPDGQFQIDPSSGAISVKAPLDRETHSSYDLLVKVQDGGSPALSDTTTVQVTISDINDKYPECSPAFFSETIAEDEGTDFVVATITCTDTDDADYGVAGFAYSITSGNSDGYFKLVANELQLAKQLDFESKIYHSVEVTVSDNNGNSPTNTIVIPIALTTYPVNEFTPVFSPTIYTDPFEIDEDRSVGDVLVDVDASDDDLDLNAHGQISYTIESGNSAGKFDIDSTNGNIFLVKTLDRETVNSYSLLIQAADRNLNGGIDLTATISVSITIVDVNDNDPLCNPDLYTYEIPENTASGTSIGTITCSDLDDGQNGDLTYAILSGSNSDFVISSTGVIRTDDDIDYESLEDEQLYTMVIEVADQGSTPRSTSVFVSVIITPVNDATPVFSQPSGYSVTIPESTVVGTSVLQVVATDQDDSK